MLGDLTQLKSFVLLWESKRPTYKVRSCKHAQVLQTKSALNVFGAKLYISLCLVCLQSLATPRSTWSEPLSIQFQSEILPPSARGAFFAKDVFGPQRGLHAAGLPNKDDLTICCACVKTRH
eukprot:3375406-Amphidinium_carterae.1